MKTSFVKRILFTLLAFCCLFFTEDVKAQANAVKKVVLDAGHGGKDPGNLGTGRYKKTEKEIALEVTLRVGAYIKENYPEVEVVYTRTGDTYPTLRQRTDLANEVNADLFMSIHCDAFDKSSAYGTSSHVMGLRYTKENLRIAQKENSVIYLEDNYEENYDGFDPNSPESIIALTLSQSTFLDQSILIAQKVQEQFKNRVSRRDRGVKQTPLWVTSRTSMPSVLIELGFLTNPEEEDFLHSENGQVYMASAIYRAFKEYKIELEKNSSASVLNQIAENQKYNKPEEDSISSKEIVVKEQNKGPIFKVQIAASPKIENKGMLGGLAIDYYKDGEWYKYTIGHEGSLEKAKALQTLAREKGYKDAFVIAYLDGKKVSVAEAVQKQNEKQ